jgi:hypothetical protein
MVVVTLITAAALMPVAARAEIVTLECSGDVTGTFTFDLSVGTGATYDDNRSIDLSGVEISDGTIAFTQDERGVIEGTTNSSGTSSHFSIDRATDKIERLTYQYFDNKVTGESRGTGQCKPAPTPHKPL